MKREEGDLRRGNGCRTQGTIAPELKRRNLAVHPGLRRLFLIVSAMAKKVQRVRDQERKKTTANRITVPNKTLSKRAAWRISH